MLCVCAAATALLAWFCRLREVGSPLFAFEFHFVGMACAVYVDKLLTPRLVGARFDVSPLEVRVYRALGAAAFLRLLRAIGWEAALRLGRPFVLRRASLHEYDHATRQGENAHAVLFAFTLAVALLAAVAGESGAVAWLVGMGVVFHVYPVMMQRTQRARLRPLLDRSSRRTEG